jgi:cytochrome c oxidase cbb3-type subunit III
VIKPAALCLVAALAITSCTAPGRQATETHILRPSEVSDFHLLYTENCSGCHGVDGRGGSTVNLGDPVYLAIADNATIRRITSQGVSGTVMPAFAQRAGGSLTDAQIDILVRGIRTRWAEPDAFVNLKPPPQGANMCSRLFVPPATARTAVAAAAA